MFKATIQFRSNATGELVQRTYESDDDIIFLNWINKYIKSVYNYNEFCIISITKNVFSTFKIPKKIQKRIMEVID